MVNDYFKTKLKAEDLDEGGRCYHLNRFSAKFQIAQCCITDLPEGLRHSDFPKRKFFTFRGMFKMLIQRLQWSKVKEYV